MRRSNIAAAALLLPQGIHLSGFAADEQMGPSIGRILPGLQTLRWKSLRLLGSSDDPNCGVSH